MATFVSQHNIDKRYIECPYNPNHKIPTNRMPLHLVKCEKQSNLVLMVCPFNASHRYPRNKLEEHINHCKNKTNLINPTDYSVESVPIPPKIESRLKSSESGDKPLKEEVKADKDGEEYWD